MSLEVAEHIPKEFEDAFLDNVVRNARCYIILSWSKLAELGSGHVNARGNDYVKAKMESLGFVHATSITDWLHRRSAWMSQGKIYRRNTNECPEPRAPYSKPSPRVGR